MTTCARKKINLLVLAIEHTHTEVRKCVDVLTIRAISAHEFHKFLIFT